MRKLLLLFAILSPLWLCGQKLTLTVNSSAPRGDTLHLQRIQRVQLTDEHQRFEGSIVYRDVAALPYTAKAVFKPKEKLAAGYYQVTVGDTLLFPLLISENKSQKITVNIDANGAVDFANSLENSNFQRYTEQMAAIRHSEDSLNRVYEEARATLPQYMLQDLVQRLSASAERLAADQQALQSRTISENPGTLLASIVKLSMPLPPPPAYILQDRGRMTAYAAEHAFENFTFTDGRLCTTPQAMDIVIDACGNLFYMNPAESPAIAEKWLNRLQANADNYHAVFNVMERAFGTIGVSFWTEEIYLAMLKNALSYSQLEERRVKYYQQIYELQSKNLAGAQLPDLHIQWGDSTTSTFYELKSDYTLLYLHDPDCHTCAAVRALLAKNAELNQAIASGRLTVVTLYFGKNETAWHRYLQSEANPKYLHGWDYLGEIEAGDLFDLRAIPVIFLLDNDKRVIRKNIAHFEISDWLSNLKIIP